MNFLNSYISIFNPKIKSKTFVILFVLTTAILLFAAFFFNRLDLEITLNDCIKNYQLSKIDSNEFSKIDTLIVGDSSGGNSINKKYFNELSGMTSENLCLTASFGIVGSLGIIKKAFKENSKIKNVIIIHAIDIWRRPFPKESILELFSIEEKFKYLYHSSIINYYLNLKEILWNLKYLLGISNPYWELDIKNDYIKQNKSKYSNGKKFKAGTNLNWIKLSDDKRRELKMLESYCSKNSINCIFLTGPLHSEMYENSTELLEYKARVIDPLFSKIKIYPQHVFQYENHKMGDSSDHIDVKHKNESTRDYFDQIKADLIY